MDLAEEHACDGRRDATGKQRGREREEPVRVHVRRCHVQLPHKRREKGLCLEHREQASDLCWAAKTDTAEEVDAAAWEPRPTSKRAIAEGDVSRVCFGEIDVVDDEFTNLHW